MTDMPLEISDAQRKALSRRTLLRVIIAGAVIVAGVVTMNVVEKAFNLTFNKPPMPLQKPLTLLEKTLGDPPGRYVAEGQLVADAPDSTMTEDVLEVLGTKDYLLRRYVDRKQPAGSPTAALHLNLNYYATGGSTPHVPEICWAGAGMVEAALSRQVFAIPNVRRKDGRLVTLRMNMISFVPPGSENGKGAGGQRLKNVAYMFAVNGDYVATPKEVTSRFWKASNKYAYDTKIELTVGDDQQYCSQGEAQAAISDFIRAALPEIEACLPDPNYSPPESGKTTGGGK